MTEQILSSNSLSSFRYVVFGGLVLWCVIELVVVLMGLFGDVSYSGGRLFWLFVAPLLGIVLVLLLVYFVVVRRSATYVKLGEGRVLSFEEAVVLMKQRVSKLSGVMPSLDTRSAFYGEGFYGSEGSTHISHALFECKDVGKNSWFLAAMHNHSTRNGKFPLIVRGVESRLSVNLYYLLNDLVDRLIIKPSVSETTTVSESSPYGGSRVVKHSKPLVEDRVIPRFNEEFVDKKVIDVGGVVDG